MLTAESVHLQLVRESVIDSLIGEWELKAANPTPSRDNDEPGSMERMVLQALRETRALANHGLHAVNASKPVPDATNMRPVTGHEGSTLNNASRIWADERDANGGSHSYIVHLDGSDSVFELPPFQKGPLKEAGLNGISDEVLLAIVMDRLRGFQEGPYVSADNAAAIDYIGLAMKALQNRTASRQARGVEGTHQI